MTRLRYIADNPPGPRGGNRAALQLFMSEHTAKRHAETVEAFYNAPATGRVKVIDLDDLLPVDATAEEALQFHESRAVFHTGEMLRTRPDDVQRDPNYLSTADIAKLRHAAEQWLTDWDKRGAERRRPADHGLQQVLRELLDGGKLP